MLGKFLAAVDEPELTLAALHSIVPEAMRNFFNLSGLSQWSALNINQGFSADGHTKLSHTSLMRSC